MSPPNPPSDPGTPDDRPTDGSDSGFVPYKDPVILTLAVILIGTIAVAAAGITAGPILSGNDTEGVVFPVDDLLNDSDGTERVHLHVEANRTTLRADGDVRVTVTDSGGAPVRSATVAVGSDRYPVDENGTVTISPETVGRVPVTASAPATNETTYVDGTISLDVDPALVGLQVRTNRSRVTVDEPVEIRLLRPDTGERVNGTVLVGNDRHDIDRDGTVVVRPDRAGTLRIVGNRSATETETFVADETTVDVERLTVPLRVSVDPLQTTAGEQVTVSVSRDDTDVPVEATIHVGNRTVETTAGVANVTVETAGEHDIRATRSPTRTERFVPATVTVEVERRSVDLSLSVDRPVTTAGGTVTARLFRADEATPVTGTITVDNDTYDTDSDGRARIQLNGTDPVTLVGAAPETDRVTFEPDERTVELGEGRLDVTNVSVPSAAPSGSVIEVAGTIENDGTVTARDTIVFRMDGDRRYSETHSLAPDERAELSFEVQLPDSTGTVEAVLSTGTDSQSASLRIEDGSADKDDRFFVPDN